VADIVLITGAPGSGKSTVSRALAERFDPSFHLKVDNLREDMVNGFILPELPFPQELVNQFAMVRRTATFMAQDFAAAGVTFVVDDTPIPETFPEQYASLYADNRVTRVLLRPDDDAVMDRLRKRGGTFDDYLLELGADVFNQELRKLPVEGWNIIDSTHLTIDETVDEITGLLG
jgi:adenylate kinase family enzyme